MKYLKMYNKLKVHQLLKIIETITKDQVKVILDSYVGHIRVERILTSNKILVPITDRTTYKVHVNICCT